MFTKKIALVSVINDLATDNRVRKTCLTLQESGYDVTLIGRQLFDSPPIENWPFRTERMRLLVNKGPLFYGLFMFRLFFKLLFRKADLLYANDLDTLWPNYLISKLKRIPLIYDSHELFCEVPELLHTPLKRRIWLSLEGRLVPKLKYCITVNDSIARIFEERYGVHFTVVRNIPEAPGNFELKTRARLNLPANKKIVLLQGAGINIDRGAEELVMAMRQVSNAVLYIIGSGDCWKLLGEIVTAEGLQSKVIMISRLPKSELMHYTYHADLGISIDKNSNPNYYNSLPNKVFDYLHAGVPLLASRLPEIEKIVSGYEVGDFIEDHDPTTIAAKVNSMLDSPKLMVYKANTERVRRELNWQNEKQKLMQIIQVAAA